MRMKYYYITIIAFVLFCIPTINCDVPICPTGRRSTANCSFDTACPSGSICYRNKNPYLCCGDLDQFCPTKLHAFNSAEKHVYSWGPVNSDNSEFYNVPLGSEKIACPFPYSHHFIDNVMILPVDFNVETRETTKPKECNANSDCNFGNDEFCGASYHPTDLKKLDHSGKDGAPLSFCYKIHSLGAANIAPIVYANKKGLVGCDNHVDCFEHHGSDSFCFSGKSNVHIVVNDKYTIVKKGICAKANVCNPSNNGSITASLTIKNKLCQKHEDCVGIFSAKKHPDWEPMCVAVPNRNKAKMCCTRRKRCGARSEMIYPLEPCLTFKDCYEETIFRPDRNNTLLNKWCDEKEKKCCIEFNLDVWTCLDLATPLANEPKCNYYNSEDLSGMCPNKAGICKNGHCCPPLKVNIFGEFTMGKDQYITNVDCKPDKPIPPLFNYAFCDPENKKIVIIGEIDADNEFVDGEKWLVKYNKKCTVNTECNEIEDEVCARLTKNVNACMHNPLKKTRVPESRMWLYMIGIATCAFLITELACWRFPLFFNSMGKRIRFPRGHPRIRRWRPLKFRERFGFC